jgi:hypothetical protein
MMAVLNNPAVAYLILLGIGGILAWIAKHLRDGWLRTALKLAAGTAAGLAYAYRAEQAQQGVSVSQRAAVSVGVDYLAKAMPDALQHFGKSQADVTDMVTGELGKLLAVDPNVSVVPVVVKVAA